MELGLRGRTAVITGGSMGMGKAAAKGVAAEGVNLVLLAREKKTLDKTAGEIASKTPVEVPPTPANMRDANAVNAAAAAAATRFGTIHILVCTAGNRMRRPDRQILWDDEDWLDDMNVKTIGMLRAIRAFLPHLAADGSGRIINVAGSAGMMDWEGAMTHGINNSAMMHASTYLAHDLASANITVNSVVPGLISTEWRETWADTKAARAGKSRAARVADYCRQKGIVPERRALMGRIAGATDFRAFDRCTS